ncbi:YdeI/OmpD-associated family protein [Roseivirga sp.]|uniref:YdeI/OmpD-associated family protein n=1 Tax=Roseivirga sp. TaxID=1964215 RepID=UPI003B52F031
MPKSEVGTFSPTNRTDWRNWLKKNHRSKQSVWLVYFKSSTKIPSITWSEAVDEALCFGWIDSTKKAVDEERYMQYFTQRKPNSIWSQINKEKVAKLIQKKLMTKAGLETIEIAKRNGSWTKLDEVEALVIPDDLKEQLRQYEHATQYFEKLSKSNKKRLLYWVFSAKRSETRHKRIDEIVQSASQGQMPQQFR